MKIKKNVVALVCIWGLLLIVTAVWSLESKRSAGSGGGGFITEFAIPLPASGPQNLTIEVAGPPARIWFTMMDADAIGHLVVTSTVDFAFSSYSLPAGSEPFDIVYDATTEAVWFTEAGGNRIGRLDIATKVITETAVPDGHSPLYIDVASNGDVWFTEPTANNLVRYQPSSMTFTDFPYNFPGGQPTRVEVLNPASVWITVLEVNRVAELNVTDGTYAHIPVNDPGSASFPPDGLALNNNSSPWISTPSRTRIGLHSPGTAAFWTWEDTPVSVNTLVYNKRGSVRQLWFTSTMTGQVGKIILDNSDRPVSSGLYALPTANSEPVDIAIAADDTVWIVERSGNQVAAWYPPYFYKATLPFVTK